MGFGGSASLKKQASAVLDTTIKTTAPERRALDSARGVFYAIRLALLLD